MLTVQALRGHLENNLLQINRQIDIVQQLAEKLECSPAEVQDGNGYMMTPLVLARSQTLLALVNLRGN